MSHTENAQAMEQDSKKKQPGLREGSVVETTYCSCRRPRFRSQPLQVVYNHPVQRIQHPLLASVGSCTHGVHINSCRDGHMGTHTLQNNTSKISWESCLLLNTRGAWPQLLRLIFLPQYFPGLSFYPVIT